MSQIARVEANTTQPGTGAPAWAAASMDEWVRAVASQLATDDLDYAGSIMRSWLHMLRDRLSPQAAAEFAGQLPDVIRRIYIAGWEPGSVPAKSDPAGYTIRFARAAGVAVQEVARAAAAVTAVMSRHLPDCAVQDALNELSPALRSLISPAPRPNLSLAVA